MIDPVVKAHMAALGLDEEMSKYERTDPDAPGVVDFKVGDLRCDAPGCGHYERCDRADYEASVGKPCPKCGASLLTPEDFHALLRLEATIRMLNENYQLPAGDEKLRTRVYSFVYGGTGRVAIEEEKS